MRAACAVAMRSRVADNNQARLYPAQGGQAPMTLTHHTAAYVRTHARTCRYGCECFGVRRKFPSF